ncbi:MAG: hypothetical protein ACI9LM_001166 [Alteromonadaceae bacterium]|jgi:hypothetical protein
MQLVAKIFSHAKNHASSMTTAIAEMEVVNTGVQHSVYHSRSKTSL